MSPSPLVDRASRAARAVAQARGLACDDATVLPGGSNVLVHLRPAPVVARVMTGTALLHDDPGRWLGREVAVGRFLAGRRLAVPPTTLIDPGPHEHDGLWMTFWAFVEHEPAAALPAAEDLGRVLRELHTALAGFPGELGPLADIRDWLDALVGRLRPSAALGAGEIDRLRSRLQALTPAVFASGLPVQPLHGDASTFNLLRTPGGLLWNDFEDVCAGPVHWDVAGLVVEARVRGADERYVGALLRAYGELGAGDLAAFEEAHRVYIAVWRAFIAQRPPPPG